MTDRNWDAELAKIDKQLASISDDKLVAEKRAAAAGKPEGVVAPPATQGRAPSPPAAAIAARSAGAWRGWVLTLVAVAAGVGLLFWPWPSACGLGLYGLVVASGATSLLGVWSAVASWKHRIGAAHLLSLAVVAWGFYFGAREVLPRVGYAIPDAVRGAAWECGPVVPPGVAPPALAPPLSTGTN